MMDIDYQEEIKTFELVTEKLNVGIRSLEKTIERKKEREKAELEKRLEYKTVHEAHDAFGWGKISWEEFETIRRLLEGQEVTEHKSIEEEALEILKNWRESMRKDIEDCRFKLLPKEEQSRILKVQIEKARQERLCG